MNNLNKNDNNIQNDEIDIKELFSILWKDKKLISVITIVFAFCSVVYSITLPNYYKSEAVLNIAGDTNSKSSLGNLSGLASIAGIALPTSNIEDKAMYAIEIIQSRDFLRHLINFDGVLPAIAASKGFNVTSQEIIYDSKIYDAQKEVWVRNVRKNQQIKPTYLEVYDLYLDQVSVEIDIETNLIKLSVEHKSPVFAKFLLELIIRESNEILRSKDLRESSDAISFLTSEIPKASLVTMRDAINQLLQSRLEMQMMARINKEYVLEILDPPFVPEKKSKPSRAIICIFGTLFGSLLAALWVLMRYFVVRR